MVGYSDQWPQLNFGVFKVDVGQYISYFICANHFRVLDFVDTAI